ENNEASLCRFPSFYRGLSCYRAPLGYGAIAVALCPIVPLPLGHLQFAAQADLTTFTPSRLSRQARLSQRDLEIQWSLHNALNWSGKILIDAQDLAAGLGIERLQQRLQRHVSPALFQRHFMVHRNCRDMQVLHELESVIPERRVVAAMMADLVE